MRLNRRGYVDTGFVKFMSDAQFKSCVQYTFLNCGSPPLKMALIFLYYSGMRVSDVVKLKVSDFDASDGFRSGYIVQQKTGRPLQFSLPFFVANMLRSYINYYNDRFVDGFLFFPYKNQSSNPHIQTSTIRMFVSRMRSDLGLDNVYYTTRSGMRLHTITVHTFRHYFLSLAYRKTGDIMLCKELVNHARIETTAKYISRICTAENRNSIIDEIFK